MASSPTYVASQIALAIYVHKQTRALDTHTQLTPNLSDPERIGAPRERRNEILQGDFDEADKFARVR